MSSPNHWSGRRSALPTLGCEIGWSVHRERQRKVILRLTDASREAALKLLPDTVSGMLVCAEDVDWKVGHWTYSHRKKESLLSLNELEIR